MNTMTKQTKGKPDTAAAASASAPDAYARITTRIVADLGNKNSMILRNHGTLTVGEEVGDAFLRMYLLERACAIQVRTLAAGAENIARAPQGTAEKVASQNKGVAEFVSRQLTWPMLRRRMDRLDDSYKH